MDVVYTFDEGYSSITAVSLISLLENNKDVPKLNIHIVDCGISNNSKEKFMKLCKDYSRSLYFVNGKNLENKIPIQLDCLSWSFVCYVRLFFSELFPDIDKLLHIDCDTIVRTRIDELFNLDIKNNYCAACYDCLPSIKYAVGFKNRDKYYSNGLILFNLHKMRKDSIQEKFVNHIVEKKGSFPHLDQDVLNHVSKDMIYTLHPKYNLMTYTAVFKEKSCDFFENEPYYSEKEILEAISNPSVIHYVGFNFVSKPWQQPCYHPYNDEWLSYYEMTGFDESSNLTKYHRKKYGICREIIVYSWNVLYKWKLTRKILFNIEIKRVNKKINFFKRGN